MSRIQKAYENKFLAILGSVKPRRFDKAVLWFRERSRQLADAENVPASHAAGQVYEKTRQRLARWRQQHAKGRVGESQPAILPDPPRFLCDSGLGGLARWLRAAGYYARWLGDNVDDDELVRQAQAWPSILLTTDSLLMERRLLRDGIIPSLWVSPSFGMQEQLQTVLTELNLPVRQPRCMKCGGPLRVADKEEFHEKIPPKTYRWLNEYLVCEHCGQLFWHGTHWGKIQRTLEAVAKVVGVASV